MKLIALSQQGKNKGKYFAIVDDDDHEYVNKKRWVAIARSSAHTNYARRYDNETSGYVTMQHYILKVSDSSVIIDHKDGNGLNNKRNNLRISTKQQNCCNRFSAKNSSPKYLGVYFCVVQQKRLSKKTGTLKLYGKNTYWRSSIAGKHIGYFKKEEEAAKAYDKRATELHGEFARLNFPNHRIAV